MNIWASSCLFNFSQPQSPGSAKGRYMLKDFIELQPEPWFLPDVVSIAVHGAGRVATECQEERAMTALTERPIILLVGNGPSAARDLLQSRQSIYYLYIYTFYLLQAREEKGSLWSSWAGKTIVVSMCGACLRDSCGGRTGW